MLREVQISTDMPPSDCTDALPGLPEGVLRLGGPLFEWLDVLHIDSSEAIERREISRNVLKAYRVFILMVNSIRGGVKINGTSVPIIFHAVDHNETVASASRAVEYLKVKQGIQLMVWPYNLEDGFRLREVSKQNDVVFVAPFAWTLGDDTPRENTRVFFMHPSPWQIELFLPILYYDLSIYYVAFLVEDDPAYTYKFNETRANVANSFEDVTISDGIVPFNTNASELMAMVDSLHDVYVDLVVVIGSASFRKKMISASFDEDFNPAVVIMPGSSQEPFKSEVGLLLDGVVDLVATVPPSSEADNAESPSRDVLDNFEAFANAFKAVEGHDPGHEAIGAFSACVLLVHAIEAANSVEPSAIAAALLDDGSYYGSDYGGSAVPTTASFTDSLNFDHNSGERLSDPNVVQNLYGKMTEIVDTSNLRFPKFPWIHSACAAELSNSIGVYGYMTNEITEFQCVQCRYGMVGMYDETKQGFVCRPCKAGTKFVQSAVGGKIARGCEVCPAGRYAPERCNPFTSEINGNPTCQDQLDCLPCEPGTYHDLNGSDSCVLCPPGKFSPSLGAISCTPCQVFQEPSFASSLGSTTCERCQDGTVCKNVGGLLVDFATTDGFYAATTNGGFDIVKCPYGDGRACRADGVCYSDESTHFPSMKGPLCGSCVHDHGRVALMGLCELCPTIGVSFVGLFCDFAAVAIVWYLVTVATVHAGDRVVQKVSLVIAKHLILHMWLSTIVLEEALTASRGQTSSKWMRYVVGLASSHFGRKSAECFASRMFPGLSYWQVETLAGWIAIPAWMLLITSGFQMYKTFCVCMLKPVPSVDSLIVSLVVNVFIIYPRVTRLVLVPIYCIEYGNERLLAADPSTTCWTDPVHVRWAAVGLAGFVCLSLGIPALFAVKLYRAKEEETMWDPRESTSRRYGFLYCGFVTEFFYWESVQMLLMATFLFINDFFYERLKIFMLCLVMCMYTMVYLRLDPFDNRNYFILSFTKHASVAAIMFPLFSDLVCAELDQSTYFFESLENRRIRDTVVAALTVILHLRFFVWAIWGCVGPRIIEAAGMRLKHRGFVTVTDQGFVYSGLTTRAQRLFRTMIKEIVGSDGDMDVLHYNLVGKSLRQICVMAHYQRVRRRREAMAISMSDSFTATASATGGAAWNRLMRGSAFKTTCSSGSLGGAKSPLDGAEEDSLQLDVENVEDLLEFTEENVKRTIGKRFTIEELYSAMLCLGHTLGNADEPDLTRMEVAEYEEAIKEAKEIRDTLQEELRRAQESRLHCKKNEVKFDKELFRRSTKFERMKHSVLHEFLLKTGAASSRSWQPGTSEEYEDSSDDSVNVVAVPESPVSQEGVTSHIAQVLGKDTSALWSDLERVAAVQPSLEEQVPVTETADNLPEEPVPVIETNDTLPKEQIPVTEIADTLPEEGDPVIETADSLPEELVPVIQTADTLPEETLALPQPKGSIHCMTFLTATASSSPADDNDLPLPLPSD